MAAAAHEPVFDVACLAPRERELFGHLCTARSPYEISQLMKLTVSTVNTYTKRTYAKLNVHSREELMARAHEMQLRGVAEEAFARGLRHGRAAVFHNRVAPTTEERRVEIDAAISSCALPF